MSDTQVFAALCAYCEWRTNGSYARVATEAAIHRASTYPNRHMVFEGPAIVEDCAAADGGVQLESVRRMQ